MSSPCRADSPWKTAGSSAHWRLEGWVCARNSSPPQTPRGMARRAIESQPPLRQPSAVPGSHRPHPNPPEAPPPAVAPRRRCGSEMPKGSAAVGVHVAGFGNPLRGGRLSAGRVRAPGVQKLRGQSAGGGSAGPHKEGRRRGVGWREGAAGSWSPAIAAAGACPFLLLLHGRSFQLTFTSARSTNSKARSVIQCFRVS